MNVVHQVGFYPAHRIGLLLVGAILAGTVLELVRRGLLKERYALLWLGTACCSLFFGLFPSIIVATCDALHFQYITLVFVLSLLFLVSLVLSFSVILSRLSEQNRELAQEVALLAEKIKRMEQGGASQ